MKNVHVCPCMLQYGWYFDNSKDFGGVKIWKRSIYVRLCCSMGDMLIIQMGRKNVVFHQIGRKKMNMKWGNILSWWAIEFNCKIEKNAYHILCDRSTLYIYIYIYIYIIYIYISYIYIYTYVYIYIYVCVCICMSIPLDSILCAIHNIHNAIKHPNYEPWKETRQ